MGRRISCYLNIAVVLASWSIGCSGRNHRGSVIDFVQSGQRTVVEVTDRQGHSWKIASVELRGVMTYFVINSSGQVDVIASVFTDRNGIKHAVEYVDSAGREEAVAVLDTRFLSGITNQADDYKKWLNKTAFSYGGVQVTDTIEVRAGGLGAGSLRVQGNTIVARYNTLNCAEVGVRSVPTPQIGCWKACCEWVNCIIGILNGEETDCSGKLSDANGACNHYGLD